MAVFTQSTITLGLVGGDERHQVVLLVGRVEVTVEPLEQPPAGRRIGEDLVARLCSRDRRGRIDFPTTASKSAVSSKLLAGAPLTAVLSPRISQQRRDHDAACGFRSVRMRRQTCRAHQASTAEDQVVVEHHAPVSSKAQDYPGSALRPPSRPGSGETRGWGAIGRATALGWSVRGGRCDGRSHSTRDRPPRRWYSPWSCCVSPGRGGRSPTGRRSRLAMGVTSAAVPHHEGLVGHVERIAGGAPARHRECPSWARISMTEARVIPGRMLVTGGVVTAVPWCTTNTILSRYLRPRCRCGRA